MGDRIMDDATTMADCMEWHRTDRPDCDQTGMVMVSDGYRCPSCGWHLMSDDAAGDTR